MRSSNSFFIYKDVTPDPGDITLFGAKRIVLAPYGLTYPISGEVVGE